MDDRGMVGSWKPDLADVFFCRFKSVNNLTTYEALLSFYFGSELCMDS